MGRWHQGKTTELKARVVSLTERICTPIDPGGLAFPELASLISARLTVRFFRVTLHFPIDGYVTPLEPLDVELFFSAIHFSSRVTPSPTSRVIRWFEIDSGNLCNAALCMRKISRATERTILRIHIFELVITSSPKVRHFLGVSGSSGSNKMLWRTQMRSSLV